MPRRLSLRRAPIAAALLAAFAAPASAEWVEWIADAAFETKFNDNLNQTGFHGDEASDFLFRPSLSVGRVFQATDLTRLSGTVDVEGELHARFDRLNAGVLGVTLAAHHKFGLGHTRPWMRLHAKAGRIDVKEHNRDGWLWEGGIQLGKRFTPRFDATLAYTYEGRDGHDGGLVAPGFDTDVWDQNRHRINAEANFLVTELLLFTAGFEFIDGDFESACPKAGPGGGGPGPAPGPGPGPGPGGNGFLDEERPEAAALDAVFGNAPGDCMYRVDGQIYAGYFGFDYPVTDRVAVDLGYRFQHGEGRVLDYDSHIGTLGFTFRY